MQPIDIKSNKNKQLNPQIYSSKHHKQLQFTPTIKSQQNLKQFIINMKQQSTQQFKKFPQLIRSNVDQIFDKQMNLKSSFIKECGKKFRGNIMLVKQANKFNLRQFKRNVQVNKLRIKDKRMVNQQLTINKQQEKIHTEQSKIHTEQLIIHREQLITHRVQSKIHRDIIEANQNDNKIQKLLQKILTEYLNKIDMSIANRISQFQPQVSPLPNSINNLHVARSNSFNSMNQSAIIINLNSNEIDHLNQIVDQNDGDDILFVQNQDEIMSPRQLSTVMRRTDSVDQLR